MARLLFLSIGGALGTISRYILDAAMHRIAGHGFPYGTLAVNLLGCFLMGFFVSVFDGGFVTDHKFYFFLIVGFCGAFTTFSTFILDTAKLVDERMVLLAAANVAMSIFAGLILFVIGLKAGKLF